MKKKCSFILLCLFCICCKEKSDFEDTKFTHISSKEKTFSYKNNDRVVEMYLLETTKDYNSKFIKNASDSLFNKESKICELDSTINNYTFTIIEKTKCTEKYLKNGILRDGCWENDDKESGNREYKTAFNKNYKRSENDRNIWVLVSQINDVSKPDSDSVICNSKIIYDAKNNK